MIVEQIAGWAERTPFRTALRHNGRNLSYAAFAHGIALARGFLSSQDIHRGGLVAIAMANPLDFWTFSLAARSLGATTILPAETSDVGQGVGCVVTRAGEEWSGLAQRCDELGLPVIHATLDGQTALHLGDGTSAPMGGQILSTSGTTGGRKRLLIDPQMEGEYHGARRALLAIDADTMFHLFNLPPWTGSGYKTPIAVWAAGGGVILDNRLTFHETLRAQDITHAVMVPSLVRLLLAKPIDAFPRHGNLQLSLTGGLASEAMVEGARARLTPLVYNRLSATETSIFGFTRLEQPDDRLWHRIVPGRRVEIVDDQDRPVPAGTLGRVRIGTEGGPTSYYGDPEASRAFFRHGCFYPGDLGVFRQDGRMRLHGRVTDIINIQGHKMSPTTLEEHLAARTGAQELCVFTVPQDDGTELLHIAIPQAEAAMAEPLRTALQRETGVGCIVSVLESLPRTETGKLLRQAIRNAALGAPSPPAC